MGVINKGHTFVSGENVTADKLNNLADNAAFNNDTTDNTTLEVVNSGSSNGYIKVRDNGIGDEHLQQMTDVQVTTAGNEDGRAVTTDHIRDDAVTTAKIASNAVTTAKLDSGVLLVPDPGTTNIRKILTAGSNAGSYSWKHNNEQWGVTNSTNAISVESTGKHGTSIIWPTVQSSSITIYRSGRNVWITGEYTLNTNYPSISSDHAFFMISMPNNWKAYNTFLTNGWHRSYASTSNSTLAGSGHAGHIGHARVEVIPGSTNQDHGIVLWVRDWSGTYLYQGSFAINFLLDDTSMNS